MTALRIFAPLDQAEPRLRDVLDAYYLPARRLRPKTAAWYAQAVRAWERLTADPPVRRIGEADLQAFLGALAGRSPATRACYASAVAILLRAGAAQGLLAAAPEMPEVDGWTPLRHVPSVAEIDAFLAAASGASWPCRDRSHGRRAARYLTACAPVLWWRAYVAVAYCTGLRAGDLASLTWSQRDGDVLQVRAAKTRRTHAIPLHPCCVAALDALPRVGDQPFAPARAASPFYRALREISAAAGLRHVLTPHAFRRAAGTEWERASFGAGRLLLGHSLGVSARYLDQVAILRRALPALEVPASLQRPAEDLRQLRLFD